MAYEIAPFLKKPVQWPLFQDNLVEPAPENHSGFKWSKRRKGGTGIQ